MFMRVARRNGLDDGTGGPRELLADFWQNGFLMPLSLEVESENSRLFIGDLNGWAWVDLNHQPRPYRGVLAVFSVNREVIALYWSIWMSPTDWTQRRLQFLKTLPEDYDASPPPSSQPPGPNDLIDLKFS
jgi:hypothetical protein